MLTVTMPYRFTDSATEKPKNWENEYYCLVTQLDFIFLSVIK